MKIFKQALFLIFLVGMWLLPASCRRTLDYQLETVLPRNYQPPAQGTIKIDGPVELNARVFVIDSAATEQIVSFSGNQIILKQTISLRSARTTQRATGIENVGKGDIVVADISEKTPRGMLKKVTNKIEVGGEVTFTLEDATFDGIFKKIKFAIEGEISPFVSLNRTFSRDNGVIGGALAMKGEFRPSGKLRFELEIDDATFQHRLASVTFKRSVSFGMEASGAIEYPSNDIILMEKSLPSIRVVVPVPVLAGIPLPIPIVITPDFVAKLKLTVGVEGAFNATLINFSDDFTYGVIIDRGKPVKYIQEENPAENKPAFEFKAGGYAEAVLRPEVVCSFYDWDGITFGVGTEIFGRLEAGCKTNPKPEEKNVLEMKLTAGARADLFTRLNVLETKPDGVLNENKVEGSITFALVIKETQSDWCGQPQQPVENETETTSVAVSTGDPHLSTFDRLGYSFQAVGEFIAVRSTTLGDNFEIQVRQEPQPNSTQVSLNTGLAIRTGSGNEIVCVYPNRVFLNNQNLGIVTNERTLANGGKLIGGLSTLTIRTAQGDQVNIRFFGTTLDYTLTLAAARRGLIKGLLGNYDGKANNDLQMGDNSRIIQDKYADLYPAYADSWRINQSQSLFVYDTDKNTIFYTDRSFPRSEVSLTSQQRANAESICRASGVTDPLALNNCIVDVALTNNRSFADRALDFQLANSALNAFSIGAFSTSDVKLEYFDAKIENRAVILDTRNNGFSAVVMRQGVNIRRGFSTEFNFSTAELNQASCFYLALWPTDTKARSASQKRVGFCFGFMDGMHTAFFQLTRGSNIDILAEKHVPNFVDGKSHKVRIEESLQTNGRWRVNVFLDDLNTPKYSVENTESIEDMIDAFGGVGYIEFQINQGSPSRVQLFNWQYNAL
jgi:hypothetical protein